MLDVKKLFVEKVPEENPDWGHARTCRALMRSAVSEYSHGVHSVPLGSYMVPNRDYAYEGLSAFLEEENWKHLDALPFCLMSGGRAFRLEAGKVQLYPWKALHSYSFSDEGRAGHVVVEYYLFRHSSHPILEASFSISGHKPPHAKIRIEPLVDIRHMYAPSAASEHEAKILNNGLSVSRSGRMLMLTSKNFSGATLVPRTQHWHYKLGNGSREFRDGGVRFVPEGRDLFVPGFMELAFGKGASVRLQASCGTHRKPGAITGLRKDDELKYVSKLRRIQNAFQHQLRKAERLPRQHHVALRGRLLTLLTAFDLQTPKFRAPDAGAYWFRNAWFRDMFQGIYENFDIYFRTRKADLKAMLLQSLALQKDGLIPNKLTEAKGAPPNYSSADSTLLCFLCALEYARRQRNRSLLHALKPAVKQFLESLATGKVRLDNYLLKAPADYSWMDSRRKKDLHGSEIGVPCRIPDSWIAQQTEGPESAEEAASRLNGPHYFLVELNALWLRFLLEFNELFPSEEFRALGQSASANFKSHFFEGSPSAIIDDSFRRSPELSSASVYAAALLPHLFSDEEIASLVRKFEPIFVYRNRKLFGLLARNVESRVFLGDPEYHGAVAWPRETPSLFRLLMRVQDPRAAELLESNLEHQMDEGAVFYNQELFALPEGPNPHAGAESYSPVPVRNPAQFWSQFVQPYFEYFDR